MRSMKINDKYRILLNDDDLPVEIPAEELDGSLSELKKSVQNICDILSDIHNRNDIVSDIVSQLMESSCMLYDDGEEWHFSRLISEIEECQMQLDKEDDNIPSYEDSETIFNAGYKEEWHGSGVYAKTLEDTEEVEIVEEIILKSENPIYRKRTIIWENAPGGRHSKEIKYEELPMDENISRLIKNTIAKGLNDSSS